MVFVMMMTLILPVSVNASEVINLYDDESDYDDVSDAPTVKTDNIITVEDGIIEFPLYLINKGNKFYYVIPASTEDEAQFSYSLISVPGNVQDYIKVSSDGKISVKKGIKTGNYNISVRITAAETDLHKETTIEKEFSVTVKKHIATFPSLKKLGLKNYSSKTNKKLDEAMERMCFVYAGEKGFKSYNKLDKARACTYFAARYYYYGDKSYTAESMLKKGYGTCFAYSELVYLMLKKCGIKSAWLTVPGKNVNHDGLFYGSYHRSVVAKINGKYYELDGNLGICYRITKSYAMYLRGKKKKPGKIMP